MKLRAEVELERGGERGTLLVWREWPGGALSLAAKCTGDGQVVRELAERINAPKPEVRP